VSYTAPADRQMVPLGQVAEFRNGVNFVAAQRGNGIPVLNVKDFQDRSQPDYSRLEQLIPAAVRRESLLRGGDILFVRSNGNKELIGRSMYLPEDPPCPTTHSAFTIRMRMTAPNVEAQYCAYFLRGGAVRKILSAQGSGTNISNLNQDILSRLEIWLPAVEVQRRIAGILAAYDAFIAVNKRRITIIEEMTRRLFDEWFVKYRYPGHRSVFPNGTDVATAPEGWKTRFIADAWGVIGGGTPSKAIPAYWVGGEIDWYTPTDLTGAGTSFMEGSTRKITARGLAESSARCFPAFSVMMTSRATLGVLAINTTEATTNQGFITCIPNKHTPLFFLFHWLKANAAEIERHASGATFKEITKGTFKRLPVVLPPHDLAQRFEMTVSPMMHSVRTLEAMNRNLRDGRDFLLTKLLSGEINPSSAERSAKIAPDQVAAE
jgi:type I restriction enzyme S subunit